MSESKPVVLNPGNVAPGFCLQSDRGETVDLKSFRDKKNVILYFYPKDNTPGCTLEACNFRDASEEISQVDTVVFGVSRDSISSHQRFVEKQHLNFSLLSDPDAAVCLAYGVYKLKKNYGREYMGIERSTFIIGKDGKIVQAIYGVKVKAHVENVLSFLKEL